MCVRERKMKRSEEAKQGKFITVLFNLNVAAMTVDSSYSSYTYAKYSPCIL